METIDFDATARRLVELTDLRLIREELRLIWNARGAADIATLEFHIIERLPPGIAGLYVEDLARALRMLNR